MVKFQQGLILLTILFAISSYAADYPPAFKDFPIKDQFSGTPAVVDLKSHTKAPRFRTVLKEGAKIGPNFAGTYTIVTWGCGTACQEFAIVDAKNGRVYFPTAIKLNAYQMVHDGTAPFQYRKDSSLLIVAGAPNDDEKLGFFYYNWNGTDLKLVHEIQRTFEPKQKEGFMTSISDNLIPFIFGILASWIAAIIYERTTRPKLALGLDKGPRALGKIEEKAPHEFYHVRVKNRPVRWPLPGRKPAWSCKAKIEVFNLDGTRAIKEAIQGRWTSQPEPLVPAVSNDQTVNIVDFARLMLARKMDVHCHEEEQLSIALKYEGQNECYIFSNESYLYSAWMNPDWRLDKGTYRIRITVFYERGIAQKDFLLENSDSTRDGLRLK
jgi:hypothetical protein